MGLEADDMGFSDVAFAGDLPPGALAPGDETLLVKFYVKPVKSEVKSAQQGRPIFENVEYVSIMVPGNKTGQIDSPATDIHRKRFAPHYRAFKQREKDDEHLEGMPLTEWPGLVRSQVEELAFFNIKTVEQLASLSDTNSQSMMGLAMLREKAKEYLKAQKDGAATEKLAHKLRERDEKIDGLQATIEQMSREMAELRAKVDVPNSEPDSQPSRRGGGANSS